MTKFVIHNEDSINKAWEHVMKCNHKFSISLYQNEIITDLLAKIILKFKSNVESIKMKPIFIMVPYLEDLRHHNKRNMAYYHEIIEVLDDKMLTIDMSKKFLKYPLKEKLYVSTSFGAHLSELGNKILAEEIALKLEAKGLA